MRCITARVSQNLFIYVKRVSESSSIFFMIDEFLSSLKVNSLLNSKFSNATLKLFPLQPPLNLPTMMNIIAKKRLISWIYVVGLSNNSETRRDHPKKKTFSREASNPTNKFVFLFWTSLEMARMLIDLNSIKNNDDVDVHMMEFWLNNWLAVSSK